MADAGTTAAEGGRPRRPYERSPAERARRRDQQSDAMLLLVAGGIVLASTLLTPGESALALAGLELPSLCVFKNLVGLDCLGCGLTRSFVYMGHLDLGAAVERHWLGPGLYGLVGVQVPVRAWRIWVRRRSLAPPGPPPSSG